MKPTAEDWATLLPKLEKQGIWFSLSHASKVSSNAPSPQEQDYTLSGKSNE